MNAMLDTGAELSCIDKSALNVLLKASAGRDIKLTPSTHSLCSAHGQPMQVIGDATITFSLSGVPFTWTFVVVAGLAHRIIIGNDFLSQYVKFLHFETNTAKLKTGASFPIYKLRAH